MNIYNAPDPDPVEEEDGESTPKDPKHPKG